MGYNYLPDNHPTKPYKEPYEMSDNTKITAAFICVASAIFLLSLLAGEDMITSFEMTLCCSLFVIGIGLFLNWITC